MLTPMTSATLNAGMMRPEPLKSETKEIPMNAALNRLMLAVGIAEDVLAELDNRTAVVRMPAVKNPAPERAHEAGSSLVACIHDVSSRIESIHQRIRNITSELEI